jgi:CheY-like chemotaxis protein
VSVLPPQKPQKRVLIVDDDAFLRAVIARDLIRCNWDVTEAGDGAQALEQVRLNHFDLVVSDVRMPKVNGIELLAAIRKGNVDLPVFMFVSGFSELSLEEAYSQGASGLFSKPFDRKTFLSAVDWALLPAAERQRDLGARLSTDLSIEIVFKEFGRAQCGRMLNIGQGGMFVGLEGPLPGVGKALEFQIELDQATPSRVSGEGIVRWSRDRTLPGLPMGCGIEFLNFTKNSLPEVISLIETFYPVAANAGGVK